MSRSKTHTKECYYPMLSQKNLARKSNAGHKRLRAHRERAQLRNELADVSRYEDDLDREFFKWDKHMSKHVLSYWF